MAIVLALLLPLVARLRQISDRSKCSANLAQIAVGFQAYASANRGFIPRYSGPYYTGRDPLWVPAIAGYLGASHSWEAVAALPTLKCPSHPIRDNPSSYVINAFAFETAPLWIGAPPTGLGVFRNAANVVLLAEASDSFGTVEAMFGYDAIYFEPFLTVHHPVQVDRKLKLDRHVGRTSNVLWADGHVTSDRRGSFTIQQFDDGVRSRRVR